MQRAADSMDKPAVGGRPCCARERFASCSSQLKWTVQGFVKGCTASCGCRLLNVLLSRVGCVAMVQAARAAASEARRSCACRCHMCQRRYPPTSCSRRLPRLGLNLSLCHLPDVNGIRWVLLLTLQGACTWLARRPGASTQMLPDCMQHAGCAPAPTTRSTR